MKLFSYVTFCGLLIALLLGVICGGTVYSYSILTSKHISVNNTKSEKNKTVVLDAGHGGIDGGAVGLNGTVEKELNLDVVFKLAALLEADGVTVVLTRSGDYLLETEGASGRKNGDLQARVKIANETPNSVFVSIHMNRFPQESVKGITLYYSPNHPDGKCLADEVMKNVKQQLQPANKRPIKEADASIYLLHRITVPAILVECGFLSNKQEAVLLADETYRMQLAIVLKDSILAYLDR